MRWLRPLLFAFVFAVPMTWAQDPPGEKPAKAPGGDPDAASGKIKLKLDPGRHTNWPRNFAFTPDSKQMLVSASDGTIAVWDVQTWQRLRVLRLPGIWAARSITVSPDGRTLAVAYGYLERDGNKSAPPVFCAMLMNLEDGRIQRVFKGHKSTMFGVVFTADGKRIITCSGDRTIRVWDIGKDEAEQVIETGRVVHRIAVSPDGKRLAEVAEDDDTLTLRDLTTGKVTASLKGGKPIDADDQGGGRGGPLIAWSADGKHIATAAGDGLRVWTADGTLRHHLLRSDGKPVGASLAFSADGRKLIGTDARKDRVVIFDVDSGQEEKDFPLKGPRRCDFSPDGKLAVAAGWKDEISDGVLQTVYEVVVWNTSGGKPLRRILSPAWLTGDNLEAGWSKDGKKISWRRISNPDEWEGGPTAFDLEEFRLLDKPLPEKELRGPVVQQGGMVLKLLRDNRSVEVLKGGRQHAVLKLPGGDKDLTPNLVKHPLTFAGKDNEQVVLLTGYRPSVVFDIPSGKVVQRFWQGANRDFSAAVSPDGRYVVALNTDQVLYIYNVADSKMVMFLFVQGKEWIAWVPRGYYAASPEGEKLMGWQVSNGIDQAPNFHPAARFRKQFYRPDLVKKTLELGNVQDALKGLGLKGRDVEETLPPRTLVKHKQDGARVTVEATAQAGSKEQPVKELQLLIDGRPARLANGDLAVKTFTPPLEKDARGEWALTLEPGKHKLSVRATSSDAYSLSEEITVEGPGRARQGTLYYVGIGVNQFKDEPALNLTGAVPDIKNMEKCLKAHCKDRYQVESTVLTDDKATLDAVLKTLKGLQGKLKPTDVAIVHYSSHGETEPDGSLYLLTHDSQIGKLKGTALPGQKLRDLLGDYPCPVLLILDACKSGKFPLSRSPTDPLSRMLADDSCGVAVLTAALAHQKAQDTTEGGVFTQALVEGLSGKAKPDEPNDPLYVHNLFSYVYKTVTKRTDRKQMPLYLPSGSVPPIVLKE